ncbi:hypothetical protein [Marinobacter vinifirmus]|uniref:Uncharacterized protein n=1 Tax=Marinobacter vinifirmus TaxID=355591 RepID=A0A558BER2_9GAMM|nr:hypothetical protein [Marinobacter vinifirmus]TVT34996.1 MAG: hypothetical protein FHK81_04870 [Marinobacter vinifirmus]
MRADLFSRTFSTGRLAGLALVALAAAGCKTEKDPDDPTLLGAPPTTAYIGVEYYYNWGAYGGEGILDYSLTNAPAWLALEDTSNKARQGVIMRGVPGLTGGERGLDDLGKTEDIDIVTTDGRMAGFQPFDIEVKHNLVSVEAPEFTEGELLEISAPRGEHCALPDLEPEGAHSASETAAQPTRRVYAKVRLERPSVTRVSIAFQLESDFTCEDPVGAISRECHSADSNMGRAIVGQDIVALGSGSDHPVDEEGNELAYVTYQEGPEGFYDRGVVTLEPGISECYIPLEVIDDRVAEPTEQARLALTEVRDGLASLGNNNAGISTNLAIADNEPMVALRTLNGGTRDTLNVDPEVTDVTSAGYNEEQVYAAILTGEREGQVNVKLTVSEQGSTVGTGDFVIVQAPETLQGLTLDPEPGTNELVFPAGVNEVQFSITAKDYADTAESLHDRLAILVVDVKGQAGLENFARGESDELMTLSFNRQITPLTWTDGFVPTDMATGAQGELYVAGRGSDDVLQVRIYDQEGAQSGSTLELNAGATAAATEVYLALGKRTERVDGRSTTYEELVVAYSDAGEAVVELYRKDGDTGAYGPVFDNYRLVFGSSGNDAVKRVGYQGTNGNLVVAGESDGAWGGQSNSGGIDTFLAVVETIGEKLKLKEVRQEGSTGNDRVAGASTEFSTPMLFGYAPGVVDGNGAVGPFFYSGTADGAVYGIGGDASEQLRHGLYANSTAWLIGDGPWSYSVTEVEEGDNELERTSGAGAGFVLGFTSTGTPKAAFTIPSVESVAVTSLDKGVALGSDVIAAGTLNGALGLLARVTTEKDPELYQNWQKALPQPGVQFLNLANYRDDEIVALVNSDAGPQVLLFSPEGRLLTAPADNP